MHTISVSDTSNIVVRVRGEAGGGSNMFSPLRLEKQPDELGGGDVVEWESVMSFH